MTEKTIKKNRGSNFTKEEELLLLEEIDREKLIIECKITNKTFSLEKGTGGGPPYGDGFDPIIEAVLNIIIVKTVVGFPSRFDSDTISISEFEWKDLGIPGAALQEIRYPIPPVWVIIQLQEPSSTKVPVASCSFPVEETLCIEPKGSDSEGMSKSNDLKHVEVNAASKNNIVETPTKFSSKRTSDWSHYVPQKLKEPLSKKLQPSISNPIAVAEQERKNEREKKEEERRQEEHKKK